jgi:hypothetical protein
MLRPKCIVEGCKKESAVLFYGMKPYRGWMCRSCIDAYKEKRQAGQSQVEIEVEKADEPIVVDVEEKNESYCGDCDKTFKSMSGLKSHITRMHNVDS